MAPEKVSMAVAMHGNGSKKINFKVGTSDEKVELKKVLVEKVDEDQKSPKKARIFKGDIKTISICR